MLWLDKSTVKLTLVSENVREHAFVRTAAMCRISHRWMMMTLAKWCGTFITSKTPPKLKAREKAPLYDGELRGHVLMAPLRQERWTSVTILVWWRSNLVRLARSTPHCQQRYLGWRRWLVTWMRLLHVSVQLRGLYENVNLYNPFNFTEETGQSVVFFGALSSGLAPDEPASGALYTTGSGGTRQLLRVLPPCRHTFATDNIVLPYPVTRLQTIQRAWWIPATRGYFYISEMYWP